MIKFIDSYISSTKTITVVYATYPLCDSVTIEEEDFSIEEFGEWLSSNMPSTYKSLCSYDNILKDRFFDVNKLDFKSECIGIFTMYKINERFKLS